MTIDLPYKHDREVSQEWSNAAAIGRCRTHHCSLYLKSAFVRLLSCTFSLFIGLLLSSGIAKAACPPAGSGITANGTAATESNCTINTTLSTRPGVQASNAANVTLNDSSIVTSGANSHGVRVQGTGNTLVTINGTSISVSGINALGVSVSGGAGGTPTAIINNSTIHTTAANTRGAAVDNGGRIFLNNTSVTTDGSAAYGVLQGTPGGGSIFINGGTITTNGQGAIAVFGSVNTGEIVLDGATVVANGTSAMGLRAASGSTVRALNGTHVTTTNSNGYALSSQTGSLVSVTGGNVETFGSVGIGAYVFNGSRIEIAGTTFTTHGANGYGLYTQSPAGLTNTFNAINSTIDARNAFGMVAFGGINNVNLSGTSVSSGINQLLFVADLPSVSAPNDPDLPTLIAANPATFNLTAVRSTLTGDTLVSGNSTANLTLNQSKLTGTIVTGAGSTTNALLQNDSVWNLTGNSNLTNLTNDPSQINFSPPTGDLTLLSSYKTLTVVNYIGQGGGIGLNSYLGADGSPSDRLVVNGGAATGTSSLHIANTIGRGALTVANGILVVDAVNGATTNPGTFALAGPVVAGPYEYGLFRSSVDASNPDAWYLRSTINCALSPTSPECEIPIPPNPPPTPNFRAETSLYAAIPSMALLYGRNLLDTLHERVGEEEDGRFRANPENGKLGWGRIIGVNGTQHGDSRGVLGGSGGPRYDYTFLGLQAGMDVYRHDRPDGSRDQAGAYFAIGGDRGNVTHFDSRHGDSNFAAYTLGGYWTHFGPTGWYLDAILQGTFYEISSTANRGLPALKTGAQGAAASLEGGYPFKFAGGYFIEPQAQLVYQNIHINDASDIAAQIRFTDVDSLLGRIGARFGRTWAIDESAQRTITAWIRPNLWNEFRGNPITSFSSETGFIPFHADLGGLWGEVNVGVSGQVNLNTTLYANASYQSRFDGGGFAYTGKAGLRFNW